MDAYNNIDDYMRAASALLCRRSLACTHDQAAWRYNPQMTAKRAREFIERCCSQEAGYIDRSTHFSRATRDALRDLAMEFSTCVVIALFRTLLDNFSSIMSGAGRPNGRNVNDLVMSTIEAVRKTPGISMLSRDANKTDTGAVFYFLEEGAASDVAVSDSSIQFVAWACGMPQDTLGAYLAGRAGEVPREEDIRPCADIMRGFEESYSPQQRWALYDVANSTHLGDTPVPQATLEDMRRRLPAELYESIRAGASRPAREPVRAEAQAPRAAPVPRRSIPHDGSFEALQAQIQQIGASETDMPGQGRSETPIGNNMPISSIWAPIPRPQQFSITIPCESIDEAAAILNFSNRYKSGHRPTSPVHAGRARSMTAF